MDQLVDLGDSLRGPASQPEGKENNLQCIVNGIEMTRDDNKNDKR